MNIPTHHSVHAPLATRSPGPSLRQLLLAILFALLFASAAHANAQAASGAIIPPGIKLNMPNLVNGDEFGHSVAIDGDTLVVSAWRTDVGAAKQQGVVYIFARDKSDPSLFNVVKTLTANDGHEFHGFGSAVAIDDDTIVVGAIYDDDNDHFQAGAAYIFERNHGGANAWGQVKKLVDLHFDDKNSTHGTLGDSLAIHGDIVVAGAPKQQGKVFVFERDKNGVDQWGLSQEIEASNYWENASFGAAILFDGNRLIIGSSRSNLVSTRFNNEGAVFIYQQGDAGWEMVKKIYVADEDPKTDYGNNSFFGAALAMEGELLYIGAPNMTVEGASIVGEVYVFQHTTGNEWVHIATITPDDTSFNNRFGASLYAVSDGVFIASSMGLNGTVHFYSESAQESTNQASIATPALAWSQAFTFTTNENVTQSRFGQPLVGSGNTVVVAASGANGVFTYPLDQLLANVPTTPAGEGVAYLPMVSSFQAQIPIETVLGKLGNNQILNGPAGFKIGAVADALSNTVDLSIATVTAPTTPLPDSVNPQSSNFLLRGSETLLLDPDAPFVVSLPVPQGADTAHLALAYLQPAGEPLDAATGEPSWSYLPGSYDADQSLFLAKVPFLKTEGANLLLVENPDMDSPLNEVLVQAAASQVRPFTAYCYSDSYPKPEDCTASMEAEVKAFFDDVWLGMVTQYHFPAKLRLLDSGSKFLVSEAYSVTALTATYAVSVIYDDHLLCKGFNGAYNPESGFLYICLGPKQKLDGDKKQALIHELFHSIQFAYRKVMADRVLGLQQDWIIEGMATSSMRSFNLGKMARTPYFGLNNLHKIDMALTQGTANDVPLDEYYAEDFWAYVGRVQNKNLGYLGPLLQIGGANVTTMAGAFAAGATPDEFANRYWEWVKNQVIEHTDDLGGGPGKSCQLADDALINGQHPSFKSEDTYYPISQGWETLQPLTAQIVEIEVPHTDNGILVTVEYEACDGITDFDQLRSCVKQQQKILHAKIYVEGEKDCDLRDLPFTDPDIDGIRNISPIVAGKRIFVLVANADIDNPHGFAIFVE